MQADDKWHVYDTSCGFVQAIEFSHGFPSFGCGCYFDYRATERPCHDCVATMFLHKCIGRIKNFWNLRDYDILRSGVQSGSMRVTPCRKLDPRFVLLECRSPAVPMDFFQIVLRNDDVCDKQYGEQYKRYALFRALRAANNTVRILRRCFNSLPRSLLFLQNYLSWSPTFEILNEHELMIIMKWSFHGARITEQMALRNHCMYAQPPTTAVGHNELCKELFLRQFINKKRKLSRLQTE